jgi:hypothetical protein
MTQRHRGWRWILLVVSLTGAQVACTNSSPAEEAVATRPSGEQAVAGEGMNRGGRMQGCIFLGDRPVLQNRAGVTYELVGDRARFQPYEGQLVEITPAEVDSGASVDLTKLSAGEIRAVNTQCPFSPTAMPGSASQAGSSASQTGTNREQPNAATPQYASPGAPNQDAPHLGRDPNKAGASGGPSPGTGNPPRQ